MNSALRHTARMAAALGLASLSLTEEVRPLYAWLGWGAWALSFILDRWPQRQERLRRVEGAAVLLIVTLSGLDFFRFGSTLFVTVAHFLLLLQSLKLLGLKEPKDSLHILLVSFFQTLSACTLSVNLWQGGVLFALIPLSTAGLFWLQAAREEKKHPAAFPSGLLRTFKPLVWKMCVAAVPVNILLGTILFVTFPRLGFRAFAGLGMGKSGYTEEVSLTPSGTIREDSSTVMWVEIVPPEARARWNGYLRGATLSAFNGKQWSKGEASTQSVLRTEASGMLRVMEPPGAQEPPLHQRITLVHSAGATLFGSPVAGQVSAPFSTLQYLADGSFRWAMGWRKPLAYEVLSYAETAGASSGILPFHPRQKEAYLQLPPLSFEKTKQLIARIRGKGSDMAKARRMEEYLRANFAYSLERSASAGENPVEDFLFMNQRGPCGYFASALAVMLRLEGIPSRVVTGYYWGTWNSQAEQFQIREKNAHAWVEAYVGDGRWASLDPTPPVEPAPLSQLWLLRLQESWDYLSYRWDKLIIEYDLYSQMKVLEDLQHGTQKMNSLTDSWIHRLRDGFREKAQPRSFSFRDQRVGRALVGMAVIGLFVWAWGRLQKRKRQAMDPAIAFYVRFLEEMRRKGIPKQASETGLEYVERLLSSSHAAQASRLTQEYYSLRFRK